MCSDCGPSNTGLFTIAGEGDLVITHANAFGRVVLKIGADDRLYVLVEGEPEGRFLSDCFRDALASGRMNENMLALVGLTGFTGAIDWGAIHAICAMAAWGCGVNRPSCVAYVVRNKEFSLLIKIVRGLFGRSQHATFKTCQEAIAWLDEKANG